jgi:hypothetical protein
MLKIFFLIGLIQLGYINCQALYGQCGGKGYTGPTKCPANYYNLWVSFTAEKTLEGYEYNENCMKTQAILNHIKINN